MIKKENRAVLFLLLIYYIAMATLSFIAKGTGDDGDSVFHFLFAKFAFEHPENFLNQWAKPLYVLFASLPAQFGFIGIKIFNVTVTTVTIYFSYRSAKLLRINNAWFAPVALCCSPMYIHLSLSGLTEPLFALALIIVIFLALKERHVAAALLVSFLPFFRSEGLIILCIYVFYLLFKGKWKLIPLLATGHVLFSFAGSFYHRDFFWVFNQLSYATLHSVYGEGSPMVFVKGMVDYLGWMLLIFFCVGVMMGIARFADLVIHRSGVRRPLAHKSAQASDTMLDVQENKFPQEEFWLVFGSFFGVWIGHMIFWSFGIFNSFGLIRVLIGVIPCAALICSRGFSTVLDGIKISDSSRAKQIVVAVLTFTVLLVLFIQLNWHCDFGLSGGEKAINKAAAKYRNELNGYTLYYTAPYVSVAFNSDFFDSSQHRLTGKILSDEKIPDKSAVIWENYAATESRVTLVNLIVDDRLQVLDTFQSSDCDGNQSTVAILKYVGPDTSSWMVVDTLYMNHFEEENFSGGDSSVVASGKYSCRVNEQNQYSPGLDSSLKQLNLQLPATVQISANFYTRSFSSDPFKHATVVVSLDHENKNYFWQGFDATNNLPERDRWTKVLFKMKLPQSISEDDVLKVYVWNTNPTITYVDDLLVELVKRK